MAARTLIAIVALGAGGWQDLLPATAAPAHEPPPAYQLAAWKAGVPPAVLYAIALQESGRRHRGKMRPWPWTLNVAGQARIFPTRRAACRNLEHALQTTRARRIDVGLGQINVGYHGERVDAPCELLDPYRNLEIAAAILREQHREGQDWRVTIGRYHSPANGAAAARYRKLTQRHLREVFMSPEAQ